MIRRIFFLITVIPIAVIKIFLIVPISWIITGNTDNVEEWYEDFWDWGTK